MEIGLFQLENLFLSPNRFLFFDLRSDLTPSHTPIDSHLKKATALEPNDVEAHLQSQKTHLEFPVVLICADGKVSSAKARELEAAGYNNIYVVTGGLLGLLSEL